MDVTIRANLGANLGGVGVYFISGANLWAKGASIYDVRTEARRGLAQKKM